MKKIKLYREKMGLTQEELSKKAKICRKTLSNYENDKVVPFVPNLKKLASIFNCDYKDLIE